MSDLRRELEELKQQVAALLPSTAAEDFLRDRYAAPEFDEHRERIIEALLSPTAQYSFSVQLADDPEGCPTRFMLHWPAPRTEPPLCVQIRRVTNWRAMHGDLPEPASHDQQNKSPEQAVTALARSSYQMERVDQTVNVPLRTPSRQNRVRTTHRGILSSLPSHRRETLRMFRMLM